MKITDIQIQKKNKEKVNIYVNDEYSFSMTIDGVIDNNLKINQEISEEEILRLKEKDEAALAYMMIIFYVGYRLHTEKEIKDKLKKKNYSIESIEKAVQKAKEYDLINDTYYVECFINEKGVPNKWGPSIIKNKLMQKGIEKNLINEKIEELYKEEDLDENLLNLANKKLKTLENLEQRKQKERLFRFLVSKGYSFDKVSTCINKLLKDEEDF